MLSAIAVFSMDSQASSFQSLRWGNHRSAEKNCLKPLKKSLTKLSVECSELNDKRVFLTKGNCQGTDKGGRGIGKVHGCGVFN